MAQISDVIHAAAVFDAARQELAWAYSGEFTDVPAPMEDAVHAISKVLNEAEIRWVISTGEDEPMATVVDKEKEVDRRKIKDWLLRLEEVACDMRAVARKELLGDYSRIDDDKLSARCFSCLPRTRRAARIIAPTIDNVALELEKLKKQYHEEFGHWPGLLLAATCKEQRPCSSAAGGQEERETSVTSDVLVERGDGVKQRIIDIINDDNDNRKDLPALLITPTILQIVGPPFVGKTALAKSIFHESSFGAVPKVWIDMRKGWNIKEIQESIIESLRRHHFPEINDGGREISKVDYEQEISKAESEADYGRYIFQMLLRNETPLLLVLDDLVVVDEQLDSFMLEKLFEFLDYNAKTVISIVTTRSEAFVKYISFVRHQKPMEHCHHNAAPEAPYRLHPLSDDKCWEIIKRTSGLDLETTAAGTAGREIARKCSGIPLAAKALGRFLQSVDPQDVWNIAGGFSSDSQQLRRLPIHTAAVFAHLKRSIVVDLGAESWLSLAYCAFVFPKGKGYGVVTRDLLTQWCSLGITTPERGASCITKLLDQSFIVGIGEPAWLLLGKRRRPTYWIPGVYEPAWFDDEGTAGLLRMEDHMHDLARYHLGDRLIIVDGADGAATPTSSSSHVNNNNNNNKSSRAYLALVRNFDAKQQLDIASILPAGILALRFEDCREMELSEVEFASAKYACLRLLDLSGCSVKKLPHSIGHLKQLRYLKAPGIQDQVFPMSITGLHELRYLILHGSRHAKYLPEAYQMLSNLLHLDLSGCTGLKELPYSFSRLWRLGHLDLSACSGLEHLDMSACTVRPQSLDLSFCSNLKYCPGEPFGWLRSLRHVNLAGCSGLQALPPSLEELTELRHLDLSGLSRLQELPMASLPGELRLLNLSGCSGLEKLPDSLNSSNKELRHLDLSGCSSVCFLPRSYGNLEKLVHLNLSGCSSLKELPTEDVFYPGTEWQWTRQLEHLDLSHCSQLTNMPPNNSIPKLQYLDLSGCFRIREEPPSLVISYLLETIRSRGGRASGPADASLIREQETNGTTN